MKVATLNVEHLSLVRELRSVTLRVDSVGSVAIGTLTKLIRSKRNIAKL